MSEKGYHIPALDNMQSRFTLEKVQQIKEDCEKALAQAEADKPQAWDFGKDIEEDYNGVTGQLRMRGLRSWSTPSDPQSINGGVSTSHMHILGNLKKIVEEEGPIVVGMSLGEADYLFHALPDRNCGHGRALADRVLATIRRYERNKP